MAEWQRDEFTLTDDPAKMDVDAVERMLRKSYWAETRPREVIEASVRGSFVLGLFRGEEMVGFARAVTDYCTFGWLCDVFIEAELRGRGLSKWMMDVLFSHPSFAGSTRWVLATRDAHELYRRYGFVDAQPGRWMVKGFGILDPCDSG